MAGKAKKIQILSCFYTAQYYFIPCGDIRKGLRSNNMVHFATHFFRRGKGRIDGTHGKPSE